MKITSIRVSAFNIPAIKSYHIAVVGIINSTASVIVEIHTDQNYRVSGRTIDKMIQEVKASLDSMGVQLKA